MGPASRVRVHRLGAIAPRSGGGAAAMALTFRSGSPWWLLEGVEADHRAGQHRQGIKRSDHDLDTATTELRTLRRQQRRAEHRISDLADDLGDIRSPVPVHIRADRIASVVRLGELWISSS